MKKSLSILLVLITLISLYSPSYAAALLEDLSGYGGNIYDVPASHPRILFTKSDIPQIITNSKNSENKEAMKAFNAALEKTTYNVLNTSSENNADNSVLFSIQAKAFNYAVFGKDTGYDAVESIVDYLKKYKYPTHDFSALQSYHQVTYTIYNASLVYDWCYDILTSEQEEYLRTELLRLADLEHQFNSLTGGLSPFGGTGTSNYIFRDFLALGIALYDTDPEIFNFINTKINKVYKPIDEYFSKSRSSFYGYQYGAFALYGHTMAYRLMDTLGFKNIFSDDMFHSLDYYMSSRLPDGNNFIEGDDYLRAKGESRYSMDDSALTMISAAASHYLRDNKFKSYYKDLSLTHTAFWYGTICFTPIDSILLTESQGTVSEYTPPESLYFGSPMGMIIATNGENENKAVIKMKISEGYRWHHQHFDAGSFEIYYKGRLTGQSAQYSRTDIDQYSNYFVQSIASNTLLIKNPEEEFTYWNSFDIAENSGGQRIKRTHAQSLDEWLADESFNTGTIKGYKASDEFSYLSGDITNAYSDKVSDVIRSFLFIPSTEETKAGMLFVIDKINSVDSSYKKTFLLHSPTEPSISENTVVIKRNDNNYNGKLTLKSVFPEVEIEGIGGEGKQWYVNGTNYAPLDSYAPELSKDPLAYGWGRVEISPAEEKNLDYMVNVIYIDDADTDNSSEPSLIKTEQLIGAETDGEAVVYATCDERASEKLTFKISENSSVKVLNISSGFWNVNNNGVYSSTVYADDESGMIAFDANAGEVTLEYSKNGKFSGGLGTESAPYVIKTREDFLEMGESDNSGVYYIQANDISMGNYNPFDFRGNYDGNGKTISVDITSKEEGTGVFASIGGNATLKNITISGSVFGTTFVGGLAGKILAPDKVSVYDCVNYADVNASVKGAGGFFGEAYYDSKISSASFVISGLVNHGNVSSPFWAGGITGVAKTYHTRVKNTGNITSESTGGGIIGLSYTTVSESSNEGIVSASPAGGIVGHAISGCVENSFNSGTIVPGKNKVTGGIVGTSDRTTVRYCYDSGLLFNSSMQIIGKINKEKGESTLKNCFYLNPEGKSGLSGTYPLTEEQLKGFSISNLFEKSKTPYQFPQLKNISPVTEKSELIKVSVNGENCSAYPTVGQFYLKRGEKIEFIIIPNSYYKLVSVSANGKISEATSAGTYTFESITENFTLDITTKAYTPGISEGYVYEGEYKNEELICVVPGYINLLNKYAVLMCSTASGVFTDCGFAVSKDGVSYTMYSCYEPGNTKFDFGIYLYSSEQESLYTKPYVCDSEGKIFYSGVKNVILK